MQPLRPGSNSKAKSSSKSRKSFAFVTISALPDFCEIADGLDHRSRAFFVSCKKNWQTPAVYLTLTAHVSTGLLLINLGTPDAPTTPAVRRYLREFLSDPRVIDVNAVGRALLLHLVILPFRPAKSAHAYRSIWDAERGSPLLFHGKDLAEAVQRRLGDGFRVELAMRYGSPSIPAALRQLRDFDRVDRIIVLPLFPQRSALSTLTAFPRVLELAPGGWDVPAIDVVPPFFDDPGFLAAWEEVARPALAAARADHVLFSFHGLPVRQIHKSDREDRCLRTPDCCDRPHPSCYRNQCFATARALAGRLGLTDYTVCFQSRLGRTPWIEPHTDALVGRLAREGKKRLAVLCPAFVADCLETLEEIGIRARDQFKAAGGEELVLVPSLNATPRWIEAVAQIAERHASRKLLPQVV
jgi:protoporphyrin/coproporphyrin ferrochelatase